MSDLEFASLLKRAANGEIFDEPTSERAFDLLTSGTLPDIQIASFLTALAMRRPKVEEIAGAARVLRAKMTTIEAPPNAIDLCGTGGDNHGTLNISTAASFVVAACGVPVAKHGNRNISSKSGAADVLEALGAKVDIPPAAAERCLRETGLCFLLATAYHPCMRNVAQVRRALGFRTVFNLLGPLCNPAGVKRQLIGVFAPEWMPRFSEVLWILGVERAWIVHGMDGLDEITTTTATAVNILADEKNILRHIEPEEAGIERTNLAELKGGTVEENATALLRLLDGKRGAYRDIVLINSAAALIVAGKAETLRGGVALAAEAIDSGLAKKTMTDFIAASNAT
jgi:anthranilate phosphoribosyltransferase